MNMFCKHSVLLSLLISIIVPIQAGDGSSWPYYVGVGVVGVAVGVGGTLYASNQVAKGCDQFEGSLNRSIDYANEKLVVGVEDRLTRLVGQATEKLTTEAEEKAENFFTFLLGEKRGDENVNDDDCSNVATTEKDGQISPLEKAAEIAKNTIESSGHQVAIDFTAMMEESGQKMAADLSQVIEQSSPKVAADLSQAMEQVGQNVTADLTKNMIQSGHQLTIDFAQNIARMIFSSALGLFGAFFTYKQIVDYFASQEKIDHLDMAAQEQVAPLLPQGKLLQALQRREAALINVERKHLKQKQSRAFYLAGCGSLLFAGAYGLSSYWIQ